MNHGIDKLFQIRPLNWMDFKSFMHCCIESKSELSDFMHLGVMVEKYTFHDYWNLYTDMLKDPICTHFGYFDGKKLVALAGVSNSSLPHTAQATFWVRTSHTGRGIAYSFLDSLIRYIFDSTDYLVIEFIVDQANFKSISLAKKLNLFEVSSYSKPGTGQGHLASDQFSWFIKYRNELEEMANLYQVPIKSVLAGLWEDENVSRVLVDTVANKKRSEAVLKPFRSPLYKTFYQNRSLM